MSATHVWLAGNKLPAGASATIVTVGIAASRRTGVAHHVADAAEVTEGGVTSLVASWLCGGSSVDATAMPNEAVECVGCQIAAAVPQGPVVYYAWDSDGELLYVGSTIQASTRIRAHARPGGAEWWPEVARLTFDEYDTEVEVRRAESIAIRERPGVYNKMGVPSADNPLGRVLNIVTGSAS